MSAKNDYFYDRAKSRDLEGVKIALKLAELNHINLDDLYKDNPELTETEQKIIELIKEAQISLEPYYKDKYLSERLMDRDLEGVKNALEIGANPTEVFIIRVYLFKDSPELTETEQKIIELIEVS